MQQIKCVMDSEFCSGNTWYHIRGMSDLTIYVYLHKHEFVGLPKCHFDMSSIKPVTKIIPLEEITKENIGIALRAKEIRHAIKYDADIGEVSITVYGEEIMFSDKNWLNILEAIVGKLQYIPTIYKGELIIVRGMLYAPLGRITKD